MNRENDKNLSQPVSSNLGFLILKKGKEKGKPFKIPSLGVIIKPKKTK